MSSGRVYPARYEPGALDLEARISFETADGRVLTLPDDSLVAGTQGTWVMRVINRGERLAAGVRLVMLRFDYQFSYHFQTEDPRRRDYCAFTVESDAKLALSIGRESLQLWSVTVQEGAFSPGDSFTLRLGDRSGGGAGSEVFWSTTTGELRLAVGPDADGLYRGIKGDPIGTRVVADTTPTLLRLLGPSVVRPGEPFTLHAALFDRNRNVVETFDRGLTFDAPDGVNGLPSEYTFSHGDEGCVLLENLSIERSGVHRIAARCEAYGLSAVSNPIRVDANPDFYVYWGDPHCHGWGDSTMHLMHLRSEKLDPLARHTQGRRVGRFDFAAPSPMSADVTKWDELWEAYRDACARAESPNEYVPFLAYEAHPTEGDRQIFFRNWEEEPIPPDMRDPLSLVLERYGERDDAMLEVHIGGAPPRWDVYQPERERMVEVCSGFGPAEWLLQKALGLGYRPAVCGASDLHLGLLGGPRSVEPFRGRFAQKYPMFHRDSGFGQGPVTALTARELTRDALWEALEARRSYATSGDRIYLDFRVNGALQGSELQLGEGLEIEVKVHACDAIDRIDVIAGVWRLHTWLPRDMDVDERLTLDAKAVPGRWLYLRVRQVNGEYAWSSPIWLKREGYPDGDQLELPAWNDEAPLVPIQEHQEALAPLRAELERYLALEEDASRFTKIQPIGILELSMGRCALFTCRFGEERLPMTIRWFFEFDIPRIRFDLGWMDYGVFDENELGPTLMAKYKRL